MLKSYLRVLSVLKRCLLSVLENDLMPMSETYIGT